MGGYYYDFEELVSEMETLNGTSYDIYSRQGELLTEIKGIREDMKTYSEQQTAAISILTVLVVLMTVVKVMFK